MNSLSCRVQRVPPRSSPHPAEWPVGRVEGREAGAGCAEGLRGGVRGWRWLRGGATRRGASLALAAQRGYAEGRKAGAGCAEGLCGGARGWHRLHGGATRRGARLALAARRGYAEGREAGGGYAEAREPSVCPPQLELPTSRCSAWYNTDSAIQRALPIAPKKKDARPWPSESNHAHGTNGSERAACAPFARPVTAEL